MTKLTPKQQRFVDAWNGNGCQAAREAGYKGNDNTLCSVAKENLRKPHILKAIQTREGKRRSGLIATREERQEFFSTVLRDSETAMKDRLKAAELLCKSEGDFIERKEISGPGGGPIETKQDVIKDLIASVDGNTRGIPVPRDPGAEDGNGNG